MTGTALVTGCSSGIGRETALSFLEGGWRVYGTARDPDRADLDALADRGVEVEQLDLTEPGDVDRVVGRILDEEGRVDCLVNNAGYGQFGPVEDVPTRLVERQFAVHCFGPHRLMRAVLPGMREAGEGRIVNVTSAADRLALAGIGVYNGSKMALAGLSDALRQEVSGTGVEVAVVQPGIVATEFYDRAKEEVERVTRERGPTDRPSSYDDLHRVLRRLGAVEAGGPLVTDPGTVAETIVEAATAPNPSSHYRIGPIPLLGSLYGTLVPGAARDRLTRLGIRVAASDPVLRLLERRALDR
ncbi:SDR family oxidoreductase [Halorarum halophilum]|uniref:SDR family oxidoreductase n=1 Tax=Halorarum halophilum TaxID=2743090 RepID=A0A7D5K7X6_9EURY|nr:SDR family oxidoreductase [Halobaculum halophilum]QLG27859.1 SDR family oxidoreductase [Halobaculum halophilum]